ncbi:MAG: hypothetical protein Q9227_006222 [Pyrenula ochraceoflavens]
MRTELRKGVTWANRRRLKLLYIEYRGTFGDVATSMTVLGELLKKTELFEVHLAITPGSVAHMPSVLEENFRDEINDCLKRGFAPCVTSAYNRIRPDVIVRGHPVKRLHESDWQALTDPAYDLTKHDEAVMADIKSYIFELVTRWPWDYNISPNQMTLVGQQPEIYGNPNPIDNHQVLLGKYKTSTRSDTPLAQSLKDFIQSAVTDNENIMYLGIGGFERKWNADIHQALRPLKTFVDEQVKKNSNWKYILFHNTAKPASAPDPPVSNYAGTKKPRTYHIWKGEYALLDVWKQTGVDIVLHHCGAGSFSDAIAAGKPMICIPYDKAKTGAGGDGVVFARKLQELSLGVGISPIDINNSWQYDVREIEWAWRKVVKNYNDGLKYKEHVDDLKKVTELFSGGKNAVEMITRSAHGLMMRRLQRGDDSCPV